MSTWALVRMQPGTCTENQRETSDFECQVYHALERLSKCVCVCTCSWTRTCTLDRFRMETPLVLEGLFKTFVSHLYFHCPIPSLGTPTRHIPWPVRRLLHLDGADYGGAQPWRPTPTSRRFPWRKPTLCAPNSSNLSCWSPLDKG